jgi:hypothetical protein
MLAVCNPNNAEVAQQLLVSPHTKARVHVDMNVRDAEGYTAFLYACRWGRPQLVATLLGQRTCDALAVTIEWDTAMMLAAANPRDDEARILELLLRDGYDSRLDSHRCGVLHRACMYGQPAHVTALLEKGADLEIKAGHDITCLMLAAQNADPSAGVLWMLLFMVGVTYCRPFVADFADSLKTSVDCAVLVTLVLSMLLKVDLRNELYGPNEIAMMMLGVNLALPGLVWCSRASVLELDDNNAARCHAPLAGHRNSSSGQQQQA